MLRKRASERGVLENKKLTIRGGKLVKGEFSDSNNSLIQGLPPSAEAGRVRYSAVSLPRSMKLISLSLSRRRLISLDEFCFIAVYDIVKTK